MSERSQKILYIASSFLAGFSVMVVELISSRIVAPIIGASVFTWTSVIGLTLLGLALGGWVGGKIADSAKSNRPLPLALLCSGLCIALIPTLAGYTNFITNSSDSILILNLLVSFYLFFIPACAIGTIQPLILKKYADTFASIGSKYGTLSASWSLGSMVGVFLTGFVLISTIGSTQTIWLVSLILFFLGAVYALKDTRVLILFALTLCILVSLFYINEQNSSSSVLFKKETNYFSAKVIDTNLPLLGDSRILLLDMDIHSVQSVESRTKIYTDMHPIFSYITPHIQDILVLGAGAYTLPKHFKEYYTDSNVTVVETDPEMIPIGNTYFDLERFSIRTEIDDAKLFVHKTKKTYDLIFGDTYNSYISVPWYLLTKEWNTEVRTKLNKNGVYAINFIGSLEGESSAFTKSVTRTFALSFPNYYVFTFGGDSSAIQNIVLVGVNGDLPIVEKDLIKSLLKGGHGQLARSVTPRSAINDSESLILTDNFSPVERLMSPTITKYFPENLKYIQNILANETGI